MTEYLKIFAVVAYLGILIGFILPGLFSAASTASVLSGVFLMVLTPVILYYWIMEI